MGGFKYTRMRMLSKLNVRKYSKQVNCLFQADEWRPL